MNQKFIQNTVLGGLMLGALAFNNLPANASGFHTGLNNTGLVISSDAFYNMVKHTKVTTDVAKQFGRPDKIATLKNAEGEQEGVIWIYENAVKEQSAKRNANFVFVAGKFKYVTLSAS